MNSRMPAALASLIAVFPVLLVARAAAVTPVSAQSIAVSPVLSACVSRSTGLPRLVNSSRDCLPAFESFTQWAQQGPSGAIGPQGTRGVSGLAGPKGLSGTAGPAGATGTLGPAGSAGSKGTQGATGAAGPVGPQGPAGANGAPGATGPAGSLGPQGPAGLTGPPGLSGVNGAAGPAGPTGNAGPSGAIGSFADARTLFLSNFVAPPGSTSAYVSPSYQGAPLDPTINAAAATTQNNFVGVSLGCVVSAVNVGIIKPAAETVSVFVLQNGAPQMVCTVHAGNTQDGCSSTTNSFAVAPGDTLGLELVFSGSTDQSDVGASVVCE